MSTRCADSWMVNPFYALLLEHEVGVWPWRRIHYTWRIRFYKNAGAKSDAVAEGGDFATDIMARADMTKALNRFGYDVRLASGGRVFGLAPIKAPALRPALRLPSRYAVRFKPRNPGDYLPWVVWRQWPRRAGRITVARTHTLEAALAVVREELKLKEKLRVGYGGAKR